MEAWRLLRTRWAAGRGTSRAHCWRARKALSPHNHAVTSVPHAPQVGAGQGTRGPCRPGRGTGMTKAQESPAYQQADPAVARGPHGASTERPGPRTAWRKVARPPVPSGHFPPRPVTGGKGFGFLKSRTSQRKLLVSMDPLRPRAPGRVGWSPREVQEGTVSETEPQQRSRSRARAGSGGGSPVGSLSEEGVGSQGREGKGRWAESRAGKRPVVCFLGEGASG